VRLPVEEQVALREAVAVMVHRITGITAHEGTLHGRRRILHHHLAPNAQLAAVCIRGRIGHTK